MYLLNIKLRRLTNNEKINEHALIFLFNNHFNVCNNNPR